MSNQFDSNNLPHIGLGVSVRASVLQNGSGADGSRPLPLRAWINSPIPKPMQWTSHRDATLVEADYFSPAASSLPTEEEIKKLEGRIRGRK